MFTRAFRTPSRRRRQIGASVLVVGLLSGLFVLVASPVGAAQPQQVSFTLEGCRNNGDVALPNGDGDFICANAAYTPGNLGKGWNELDLVPYRLTAQAGGSAPANQTYSLTVVLDREDAGRPGYDVLSVPVLNDALSDASCDAPQVGAQTSLSPGLGGADTSIYRLVTITQAKGTECVYDYYGRLALGSHLYPGSSLHANLANENLGTSGVGSKEVSIPVKEILPQELSKDMSATQGSGHTWNVTKEVSPANLLFGETCVDIAGGLAKAVSITVSWQKLAASPTGDITVVTDISATNPAARVITVNVSDQIYSGLIAIGSPMASGPVNVPANSTKVVLHHETTVPAGTTNLNDIATATYTDLVTGVPVPGTTEARASATVQVSQEGANGSAVISDVESISGGPFSYSVDSFSGASGTFSNGYLAGTKTTGNVTWVSQSQSSSGSVTFQKTVYVDGPAVATGTLSDTASLLGSDGFSDSASASVALSANATVSLTINKLIPNVLQDSETATFGFKVWTAGTDPEEGVPVATPSITFDAGDTSGSATVSGLAPGVYFVTEDPVQGWNTQPASGLVDLSVGRNGTLHCTGSVSFTNDFGPASAKVVKVTDPPGAEDGWTMCLSGPGIDGTECVDTADGGKASFGAKLQEGTYNLSETVKPGWRQKSSDGCSFTVNYPADHSRTFTCTFNNERLGRIIIEKRTDPPNDAASFAFTLTGGPSELDQSFSLKHGVTHDSEWVQAGSGYAAAETVPTGWDQSEVSCDDGSQVGNISVAPGETVTCTFVNTKRGAIVIKKVTDPEDANQSFDFTLKGGTSNLDEEFALGGGGSREFNFVEPGDGYAAAEDVPDGWDQTAASCDDESPVDDIDVDPGEIVTCTFENTQRGEIVIRKVTDPAGGEQSFDFSLVGGPSELDQSFPLAHGDSHESGFVKPGDGYAASESAPAGWDQTSAICDDGSSVDDIDVSPGEVVTCTFTNTQRGEIVIRKVTDPAGADQSFGFTLNGGPSAVDQSFSLTDGGSHESGFVKPGDGYVVRENVPSDWTQTSAICDDGSPVTDIDVSPGELVTCMFTNTAKPNGISLDKKVNGGDHATAGEALLGHAGDLLTYTVVITNTGQVPLTITDLSDSLHAGFAASCQQGVGSVLTPGASFTCTYQTTAAGDAHNVAAVDAVDGLDRPVTDSDDTFVDIINPAISIVKTADPVSISGSGTVTYTYVVTNTGDITLVNVLVTDDILGPIGAVGQLAPGESITMSKTVDVDLTTPPVNIGTVVGTDPLGLTVSATDDAVITVVLGEVLAQPELPRTGAPLGAQTRAALAMIQVGIVLTLAGRRRRVIRRAD